jgi:thymidylate kinase
MIDGPRIDPTTKRGVGGCLWRWLSRVETHYYGTVLRPDITLRLAVPVEVALRRNRQRVKADKESDEYLVQRHLTFGAGCSAFDSAIEVETGGPKQDVMLRLKQDLWRRL